MNNSSIGNFETLKSSAKSILVNGFIQGVPLGKMVTDILDISVAFGTEEATYSEKFPATIDVKTREKLAERAIMYAVDGIFQEKMENIIRELCDMGGAFGFQIAKHREKYITIFNLLDTLRQQADENNRQVDPKVVDEFLGEIMMMPDSQMAEGVDFVKVLLTEIKAKFPVDKVTNYRAFVAKYMSHLLF